MTQYRYPEVADLAAACSTAVASIGKRPSREAFNAARDLVGIVEQLDATVRGLRNRMALRVQEAEQLTLAELAEALDWPVTRGRLSKILQAADDDLEQGQVIPDRLSA